jgi:two-component system cell cycle sensor histidine kinase/response regulator CckA
MPRGRSPTPTVLLVDDEPAVRRLLSRHLLALGCSVLEAGDGPHALRLIEQHHDSIALVLADVVMPGMNGTELAGRVLAEYPDLRVLLISAFGLASLAPVGYRGAIVPVIQKPFHLEHLRQLIELVLDVPTTRKAK